MIGSNINISNMTSEEVYNEGIRIMEDIIHAPNTMDLNLSQKHYNLALQLFWEASRRNYLPAHIQLANYYDSQVQDKKSAFEFYLKASVLGDAQSRYIVSIFLNNGWGVEQNKKSSFLIMQDLAREGYDYAQLDLALYLLNGEGCEPDRYKAFEYFSLAAKQGNPFAQNDLGLCYLNAEGTDHNPLSAVYWFNKAAKNGNYQGLFNIGSMLFNGNGIKPNKDKSIDFFMVGAIHNEPNCIRLLEEMKIEIKNIPEDTLLDVRIEPIE